MVSLAPSTRLERRVPLLRPIPFRREGEPLLESLDVGQGRKLPRPLAERTRLLSAAVVLALLPLPRVLKPRPPRPPILLEDGAARKATGPRRSPVTSPQPKCRRHRDNAARL